MLNRFISLICHSSSKVLLESQVLSRYLKENKQRYIPSLPYHQLTANQRLRSIPKRATYPALVSDESELLSTLLTTIDLHIFPHRSWYLFDLFRRHLNLASLALQTKLLHTAESELLRLPSSFPRFYFTAILQRNNSDYHPQLCFRLFRRS